jgi:hypothetical protein
MPRRPLLLQLQILLMLMLPILLLKKHRLQQKLFLILQMLL